MLPQHSYGVASVAAALDTMAKWLIYHHNKMHDEIRDKMALQGSLGGETVGPADGLGSASRFVIGKMPASWRNAMMNSPTVSTR